MAGRGPRPTSVDEYLAGFPAPVRAVLERIRLTIRKAAPHAQEVISYGIPAFRAHGVLVYFAAFQRHIGLFPPVRGDERLSQAVAPYAGEKGNLRFPLDRPIPYGLIGRIARLRVRQDREKASVKPAGKRSAARSAARPAARPAARSAVRAAAPPAARRD